MAKKMLILDCTDEYTEELSTSAVTMWITRYPVYTFAYHLNELFDIELEYNEPLKVTIDGQESTLPLYLYQDTIHMLNYILIENISFDSNTLGQRAFSRYDKTLIINGIEPEVRMEQIRTELTSRHPLNGGLPDMGREARRIEIMDNGIIESACIDFSDPDHPVTDAISLPQSGKRVQRLQQYLTDQTKFMRDVLMAADYLLHEFEDVNADYSTLSLGKEAEKR